MMSPRAITHVLKGGASGRGTTIVGDPPVDKSKDPVEMKASVFFDGTLNNRTNVSLARANPGKKTVAHGTDTVYVGGGEFGGAQVLTVPHQVNLRGGSYDRYYSNVAILDYMLDIQNQETEVAVYVEGIGTLDYGAESMANAATGSGATGIPAKVTRGITLLAQEVQAKLKNAGKRLGHLRVDVYGFSRGAAAARHFVARRTADFFPKEINLAGTLRVAPATISINFVGLYDTVSSYVGMRSDLRKLFNNVQELHLNIGGTAKRVVQLAAADEYRRNFSLTNIDSSRHAGVGYQCVIPGDHSDVGGGHQDNEVEAEQVFASQRAELEAQGWFTAAQFGAPTPGVFPYFGEPGVVAYPIEDLAVVQAKRTVRAGYQFIPLALMMALAKKQGAAFKGFGGQFAAYQVPAPLRELQGLMHASVVDKQEPLVTVPATLLRQVRNHYLHRSTDDSFPKMIANGGRTVNGRPQRKVISDANPS